MLQYNKIQQIYCKKSNVGIVKGTAKGTKGTKCSNNNISLNSITPNLKSNYVTPLCYNTTKYSRFTNAGIGAGTDKGVPDGLWSAPE